MASSDKKHPDGHWDIEDRNGRRLDREFPPKRVPIPCENGSCKKDTDWLSIGIGAGLICAGGAIIIIDIVTVPTGEGACGYVLIRYGCVALGY